MLNRATGEPFASRNNDGIIRVTPPRGVTRGARPGPHNREEPKEHP